MSELTPLRCVPLRDHHDGAGRHSYQLSGNAPEEDTAQPSIPTRAEEEQIEVSRLVGQHRDGITFEHTAFGLLLAGEGRQCGVELSSRVVEASMLMVGTGHGPDGRVAVVEGRQHDDHVQ